MSTKSDRKAAQRAHKARIAAMASNAQMAEDVNAQMAEVEESPKAIDTKPDQTPEEGEVHTEQVDDPSLPETAEEGMGEPALLLAEIIAALAEDELLMLKRFTPKELRILGKAQLATTKEEILKAGFKFGRTKTESPIATMRRILASQPDLTMTAKDLTKALSDAGFPDTPKTTVNATLAGWMGDLRALQAAGRIAPHVVKAELAEPAEAAD